MQFKGTSMQSGHVTQEKSKLLKSLHILVTNILIASKHDLWFMHLKMSSVGCQFV